MKKIIGTIHLWLGLASGLIVVILGVTGCLLAFEVEVRALTEPFRKVAVQQKPYLAPSVLKARAEQHLASHRAVGVEYPGQGKAAVASYYDSDNFEQVFLNPYTGRVLKHKNMHRDFFRIVLNGHYNLWLPRPVGKPVVASATLVFVCMMITGLILWWPRNKAAARQRFAIKWQARWRRKNYDLHNVLGFYVTWVAIFIALTGLVFGFEWFAKSVYWVASAGRAMEQHQHPVSDTTQTAQYANLPDRLWQQHKQALKPQESLGVYFAAEPADPLEVVVNHQPGTYYNSDYYHYDQYTGKHLHAKGSYDGKFSQASVADKVIRLNYDVHVGAALGLPGKMLAFFASLVAASLPVTGFIIWWGRRKKSNNKVVQPNKKPAAWAGVQY